MQICRLYKNNLEKALELVWRVFEQCSKADYEEMDSGEMVFFGAYESNRLVGVVAMRSGFHVSLLFVEKAYQRRGVAWRLLRRAVAYCVEQNVKLRHITVNASPNGVPAYLAMGFYPMSEEQKKDGMRFTPMRLDLEGR